MSSSQEIGSPAVAGYEFSRWKRFGHDRLYVAVVGAADGEQLGYRDLASGEDHPSAPHHAPALSAAADGWAASRDVAPGVSLKTPPVAEPRPAPTPWLDLTTNRPGASAQVEATGKRAEAPVRTTLARVLGVHTDERAWRVGAKGERLVAEQLDKLTQRDRRWTAIHAIPVGNRGADIDHLVMGPGGVFTLNTKHHPDADVWVGGDTFIVNGNRVPYVRSSRHEAERATRLLTAAAGRPVPVTGLIVPVGCNAPMTIKAQPRDVHVVARRDLVSWFSRLGPVWREADLAQVWEVARRSTTWAT